jgi:hypothetical protein
MAHANKELPLAAFEQLIFLVCYIADRVGKERAFGSINYSPAELRHNLLKHHAALQPETIIRGCALLDMRPLDDLPNLTPEQQAAVISALL